MIYDNNLKQDNTSFLKYVEKEMNFEALLDKYGPEGLYIIADKLKAIADEDMKNAL